MERILHQLVNEELIVLLFYLRALFYFIVMAGMKIEKIQLDKTGAVAMKHVTQLAEKNKDTLACGIVTYPSTSGVFEETIK